MTAPESLPEKIKQFHADFIDWFRDMELPMSDSAGRLFDAMASIERAALTPTLEAPAGVGEAVAWRYRFKPAKTWVLVDKPASVVDADFEQEPLYAAQPKAQAQAEEGKVAFEKVRVPEPLMAKLSWAAHVFGGIEPPSHERASYSRALDDLRSARSALSEWFVARHAAPEAPQPKAPPSVGAWQPIKLAPRDGTNVMLRFGLDGVSQGKYVPGLPHPWKFVDTNDGITWLVNHAVDGPGGPSHFMPMPSTDLATPTDPAVEPQAVPAALTETPPGWKLAPIEPTEAMLDAGSAAGDGHDWSGPAAVYAAMLASTPPEGAPK